ncbi:MAG TPA: hypothetical protein PK466_10165 [Thermotogota bacterium]|nr:hypothetical protein [Thermotogota bacterium]HPJ88824.1 hypothetical protein [Thermotogota bacterium]HPR96687.1 hypothetical protein [Thermotogota bacterium]
MKKTILLLSALSVILLFSACSIFGPDPTPTPTPPQYSIDGIYSLITPAGTLTLEDMESWVPDVIVEIPGQGWDIDSTGFNSISTTIINNTFSFSATNTMNGNHLNLTGFTVGENSINGSINYNGNTVNVTGVRHMN